MKKTYVLNSILAGVVAAALLALVIARAICPVLVFPGLGIPNPVLLSLIALVLNHYVMKGSPRCYICIPVLSALTFGLLPWAAGFTTPMEALKLAVLGGVVFTATTWLYSSAQDRLSSGPAAKAAPVLAALGLYLAVQGLMGIF